MPHTVALTRHLRTDSDAVKEIQATLSWNYGEPIALHYALKGDLSRLRVPKLRPARKSDRLWEHTCFEAFFALKGEPAYYEINLAPSGEWAVYSFHRYREPAAAPQQKLAPEITARSAGESFQLDVSIWMDCLRSIQPGARLSVALSAVIEDNRGRLSYWALKHPSGKPDFHHRDGFALEIERPAKTR
jgi:hypothetical protein